MSKSFFGSVRSKLSSKNSSLSMSGNSEHQRKVDGNPFRGRAPSANTNAGVRAPNPQIQGTLRPSLEASLSTDIPFIKVDAPPAYSSVPQPAASAGFSGARQRSPSPAPSMRSITSDSDPYAFLGAFDTVFVIDDSGSMAGSRWKEVNNVLASITPICTEHDKDGIDIYFLNHRSRLQSGDASKTDGGYYGIKTPAEVETIFNSVRPGSSTPTAQRLQSILRPYTKKLKDQLDQGLPEAKPVNIIVLTDGAPTDEPEEVIAMYAQKLTDMEASPHQVGIQFFQVGNDLEAAEALRHLDDDLSSRGVRDIVDTVSWNKDAFNRKILQADDILKVVLGAVVRRIDKRSQM
jgi:uncharacterized protein YegL